jgi:hypothetical protein
MMGPFLVAATFWLFIGACAVTAIITDYKKRRMGVDLLHAAIDKGQPLDQAIVDQIFARDERGERIDPLPLKLGGIITISAGVGVAILAVFVSQIKPAALFPMLGGGLLVICVGVGLMIGARVVAEARTRELAAHSSR